MPLIRLQWASVRDGAGYSMHQKKHIISIFDQDRSFQGVSRPAFEYLSRMRPIRVDEDEESIISAMDRILDFGAMSTTLEDGESVHDGELSAAARSAAVMNGLRGHIMDLNAELGILTSDA